MTKVFVGLSGGVDSSVSAALLKKAGYEVTGVFIRVWQPTFFECGWKDDRLDAMRVCAKLNIPFREINLEKEYKKEVVEHMIREYRAGRTPNPDVSCNRFIKFGAFYAWARKQGAHYIATGHYARILKLNALRFTLYAGLDSTKDQSYFLWQIKKEQLPHILFPVGMMKKLEVRKIAKRLGLITADKKDSQGLCFVGKIDMKEFLSRYIKPKKGEVHNESGEVIGEHDGAFFYTMGERILGRYVVAKDIRKNTLVVSHKNTEGVFVQARREIAVTNCNWVGETPCAGDRLAARLRYRAPLALCHIFIQSPSSGKGARVVFDAPQLAAPGQSLVLYDGSVCLGGGVIL